MNATDSQTDHDLEKCKLLWDEYKYRHDLIWQRTFTFTTAIVLISIVPYIRKDIACLFRPLIITVPFLAIILTGFALPVICNELNLFGGIKKEYQEQRKECLGKELTTKRDWLRVFVIVYFGSLLVLSIVNFVIALVWLPRLLDQCICSCS